MQVGQLWRYPVKSMQGERLTAADVGPQGLAGDRELAVVDAVTGVGLTARRRPELLLAAARRTHDGAVVVTLPDGSALPAARADAALSAWLDQPVRLARADEAGGEGGRDYENPDDPENEDGGTWSTFTGAPGPFHDDADARVTLLSLATAGGWDVRRFRPNVVLVAAAGPGAVGGTGRRDTGEVPGAEDALVGRRVALGGAVLDVRLRLPRCVVVTRAQPGGIERDPGVLRTVHREHGGRLAVGAVVVRPGRLQTGDRLTALASGSGGYGGSGG